MNRIFTFLRQAVLPVVLGLMAVAGCEKPTIVTEVFTPTLSVSNRASTFKSGEDLRFVVHSNHDTYILRSWSLGSRIVSVKSSPELNVSHRSGSELVLSSPEIAMTHKGKLQVVVEDPKTGIVKTLEASYTAISVGTFSLEVMTPVVHDGEDLVIRVTASHPSFEFRSVQSSYVFENIQVGREYSVGPEGYKEFVSRRVTVTENARQYVRAVLYDSESDTEFSLEAAFETVKPTVISVSLVYFYGEPVSSIYNGDTVYLRVYDTQSTFVVDDFYSEFGSFLTRGSQYSVNADGYYEAAMRNLRVTDDHAGYILLVLRDPVSGGTYRFSVDYDARVSRSE